MLADVDSTVRVPYVLILKREDREQRRDRIRGPRLEHSKHLPHAVPHYKAAIMWKRNRPSPPPQIGHPTLIESSLDESAKLTDLRYVFCGTRNRSDDCRRPASSIYSQDTMIRQPSLRIPSSIYPDVSPPDSPMGERSASPNVSPITEGSGRPSVWKEKIAAAKAKTTQTMWDDYSGEPSDQGKTGQVVPGEYATRIPAPKSFGVQLKKALNKEVRTPWQPKEAWKGQSGRTSIQPEVADAPRTVMPTPKKLPTPNERRQKQGWMRKAKVETSRTTSPPMDDSDTPRALSPSSRPLSPSFQRNASTTSPVESPQSPPSAVAPTVQSLLSTSTMDAPAEHETPTGPRSQPAMETPPAADPQSQSFKSRAEHETPPQNRAEHETLPASGTRTQRFENWADHETPPASGTRTQRLENSATETPPASGTRATNWAEHEARPLPPTPSDEQLRAAIRDLELEPASRFSWTTYATTASGMTTPRRRSPERSILDRKRPIPTARTTFAPSRKPTPPVDKRLPSRPEESAPDRVMQLEAKIASLQRRKDNLATVISELDTVAHPTSAAYDAASRMEVQRTVTSLEAESAAVAKEMHETGLMLHRVLKKRGDGAEPTGLWVRRVTE